MDTRFVALGAAALCLELGAGAAAQSPAPTPTPVSLPTLPPARTIDPYVKAAIDVLGGVVRQQITNSQNTANGTVSFYKRFDLQVQTGTNAYRTIHLHQGTIINPRGVSIADGQTVSVGGVAQSDGSLNANVVTIQQ